MTDCKHFPDHLIYSSRKMAARRSLSREFPGDVNIEAYITYNIIPNIYMLGN